MTLTLTLHCGGAAEPAPPKSPSETQPSSPIGDGPSPDWEIQDSLGGRDKTIEKVLGTSLRSALVVPVLAESGIEVTGALLVGNPLVSGWNAQDAVLLQASCRGGYMPCMMMCSMQGGGVYAMQGVPRMRSFSRPSLSLNRTFASDYP